MLEFNLIKVTFCVTIMRIHSMQMLMHKRNRSEILAKIINNYFNLDKRWTRVSPPEFNKWFIDRIFFIKKWSINTDAVKVCRIINHTIIYLRIIILKFYKYKYYNIRKIFIV